MSLGTAAKKKAWVAWFRPRGRGMKCGPMVASLVDIAETKKKFPKLIITVSKASGTAVRRNKFRRMVRAYFEQSFKKKTKTLGPQEAIWIRLDSRHVLAAKIQTKNFAENLQQIQRALF